MLKPGMWKRELEAEAISLKKVEVEANSEAYNFIGSWKRKRTSLREGKRKQTRKQCSSRGAGSGSSKNLTASTSLLQNYMELIA